MKLRRYLLACTLVGLSQFNSAQASGIPVIDAAAIAKYIEQIALTYQQLEQAKRQFESMTGTRNLGDILNDPTLRASLPADIRGLLDNLEYQSAVLSNSVNSILAKTRAPVNFATDRMGLTERKEQINANISALTQQAYDIQQRRQQQIDSLQQQINLAHDPKAISDLQARIAIEQANIQVEQRKAELAIKSLEAERALIIDRERRVHDQPFHTSTVKGATLPGVN